MELEKSQKFVSETDKENFLENNTELREIKIIEGTPFAAVRLEDKWFLTLGKYRLTEVLKTYEECLAETENASWDRIMQVIQIMIEENKTKQQ